MTKKLGPLPVWAWGLIFGVAGYFLYERYVSSSSASSTAPGTTGILDPNAVDPNTGLTYGEEEAAAMNANAAAQAGYGSGAGGSVGTTDSGAQSTVTPTNEFGDFLTFMSDWTQMAQSLGWQPPVSGSAGSAAAAASPPVTASSPPTSSASAHTQPVAAPRSASALDTLTGLLNTGYKKVSGTTQKGGLPETGTYTKGGTKYFVYGTTKTGYQIRKAA